MTDHHEAELSILAAALAQPGVATTISLAPEQFALPVHGNLWRAIGELHRAGTRPDPVTVIAHLSLPAHLAHQMGEVMIEAATYPAIAGNAEHYADVIRDRAERRRVTEALNRLRVQIEDEAIPAADTLAAAERELVRNTRAEVAAEDAMTLDEFVDQPFGAMDWIIPDLLARDDRLVLTGVEGMGKSIAMRQIGVTVACGLHPFSLRPIPARRVLIVDCENPKRIMADKLGVLRDIARRRGQSAADRLWIKRFPQGLDLASPNDRLALDYLCQILSPDLLLIGPAYKLYVGGANSREEDLARLVTAELDRLRERHQFALILEHHSPHAAPGVKSRSVRPIGSSLWLRWPEFGIGLAPADGTEIVDRIADVRHWRGARDERQWPSRLEAGRDGEMPWIDPNQLRRAA